jgi:hypothetical protein
MVLRKKVVLYEFNIHTAQPFLKTTIQFTYRNDIHSILTLFPVSAASIIPNTTFNEANASSPVTIGS